MEAHPQRDRFARCRHTARSRSALGLHVASALQDGWTVFFALAGLHLALSVLESEGGAFSVWGPLLCGVTFGLGVASKFYVIPIEAVTIVYLAVVLWRQGRRPLAVWVSGAMLLSSLLTFTLTYVPWFRGWQLGDGVVRLSRSASGGDQSSHAIFLPDNADIRAWQWFVRPFVAWQEMEYAVPLPRMGIALANPVTWLAVLASAVVVFIKRRTERGATILLGALSRLVRAAPRREPPDLGPLGGERAAVRLRARGLAVEEVGEPLGRDKTVIAYVASRHW